MVDAADNKREGVGEPASCGEFDVGYRISIYDLRVTQCSLESNEEGLNQSDGR